MCIVCVSHVTTDCTRTLLQLFWYTGLCGTSVCTCGIWDAQHACPGMVFRLCRIRTLIDVYVHQRGGDNDTHHRPGFHNLQHKHCA